MRKLNNETTLEAQKWYDLSYSDPVRVQKKMNIFQAIKRTVHRFVVSFFLKRGYRDGFYGFMVAYFLSLYQIVSYAKYRDLNSDCAIDQRKDNEIYRRPYSVNDESGV